MSGSDPEFASAEEQFGAFLRRERELRDVSVEEIAPAQGRFRPLKMRLVREQLPGGVTLIDDCYNANPASSGW